MDPTPQAIQDALQQIRSAVDRWTSSGQHHPEKTSPSPIQAGDRMVRMLIGWLFDDEQKTALCDDDRNLILLHAAAWLTHLGACHDPDAKSPPPSSREASLPEKGAGEGGFACIRSQWPRLGIGDDRQARNLEAICRFVVNDPLTDPQALAALDDGSRKTGDRIGLIAAGLQLARVLDLSNASALGRLQQFMADGPPPNRDVLAAGFDVISLGVHPYLPGTIRAKIRCRDAELHRALKHHERFTHRRLAWLNKRVTPRFLFSEVVYDIVPEGYVPLDMKFSVDSSAALQLFTGNRLYADKRTFLRELVQNAVDACRFKKALDPDYAPDIAMIFNADISRVTIRDNGIGMDRQWLEKYFLNIGISFYRSEEARRVDRDSRLDVTFISQFGIGFLSSFLVADKIVIRTRRPPDPGLKVTIASVRDYFDVRLLEDPTFVGTEVTLHLIPSRINYSRQLEFVGYLKTNIRFLSVPVRLTDQNGHTTLIGNERLAYEDGQQRGIVFVAPLDFDDSKGSLMVKALKQTDYIQGVEPARGGIAVFQDGIFVAQMDHLLPEGARQNVIGRINLLGRERCELSMDRNRIFWKKRQIDDLKRRIHHGLVDLVDQFIAALDAQAAPDTIRAAIVNQLSLFFDVNVLDDAMVDKMPLPIRTRIEKRFRDFVRIHYRHARPSDEPPGEDEYGQRWQRAVLESFPRKAI